MVRSILYWFIQYKPFQINEKGYCGSFHLFPIILAVGHSSFIQIGQYFFGLVIHLVYLSNRCRHYTQRWDYHVIYLWQYYNYYKSTLGISMWYDYDLGTTRIYHAIGHFLLIEPRSYYILDIGNRSRWAVDFLFLIVFLLRPYLWHIVYIRFCTRIYLI